MSRLPRDDERVARLLDGGEAARDPSYARMVAVVARMRVLGGESLLDPDPDFRARLRERLLARAPDTLPRPRTPDGPGSPHPVLARTHGSTGPTAGARDRRPEPAAGPGGGPPALRPPPRARRRRRRAAGVPAAALVTLAFAGSTVLASGGALPGERLYGLKRTVERAELALVRDDAERGRRHLRLASARARDIGLLAASPGHTTAMLGALDEMDLETRQGARLLTTVAVAGPDSGTLADVRSWADGQRRLVDRTRARLPGTARDRAEGSLKLLSDVSRRATDLGERAGCGCPSQPADELGPLPCLSCVPAPATDLAGGGTATGVRPEPTGPAGRYPAGPDGTPARPTATATATTPAPRPGGRPGGGPRPTPAPTTAPASRATAPSLPTRSYPSMAPAPVIPTSSPRPLAGTAVPGLDGLDGPGGLAGLGGLLGGLTRR